MKLLMETYWDRDTKIIRQDIKTEYGDHTRHHVFTSMIDTADSGVRTALIALGWTPPKEDKQ